MGFHLFIRRNYFFQINSHIQCYDFLDSMSSLFQDYSFLSEFTLTPPSLCKIEDPSFCDCATIEGIFKSTPRSMSPSGRNSRIPEWFPFIPSGILEFGLISRAAMSSSASASLNVGSSLWGMAKNPEAGIIVREIEITNIWILLML